LSGRAPRALVPLLLSVALGCTVSTVVGLTQGSDNEDAGDDGGVCDTGTCTCPALGPCNYLCEPETCPLSCSVDSCDQRCDGGVCFLSCELNTPCSPICTTPLLQLQCIPSSEHIDCQVVCDAPTPWTLDCKGGGCTVGCGVERPATVCDGGVATCSASCP
jgi:hypothetical protein